MIEVYNTLIHENEIVGVGPLMVKRSADPMIFQLHNERTFYFEVYTKWGHFVVTTDPLSFKEPYAESSKREHEAVLWAHKALRRALTDNSFIELYIYKEHSDTSLSKGLE